MNRMLSLAVAALSAFAAVAQLLRLLTIVDRGRNNRD